MFQKFAYLRLSLGIVAIGLVFLLFARTADEGDWFFVPFISREVEVRLPAEAALVVRQPITLLFGGDMMLSRTVNAKMTAYHDYLWPFKEIASTSAAADITVANLESPFLKEANYQVLTGSFSFKADPKAVEGLSLAGIDVVSLANNHMLNAGSKGLRDTVSVLEEAGIKTSGAGSDETTARQAAIIERGGWKVAFLSYAYPEDNSVATAERPGIADMDLEKMAEDIGVARTKADLVIIQMHAGSEYVSVPGASQKEFAHAAIDAGADAVIGHHPHWPQSWEMYKNKLILYSLGNFIFDQMWSAETSRGLLARLTFSDNLSGKAELIPIEIVDYGQARLWPAEKPVADFWNSFKLEAPVDLEWSGRGGN